MLSTAATPAPSGALAGISPCLQASTALRAYPLNHSTYTLVLGNGLHPEHSHQKGQADSLSNSLDTLKGNACELPARWTQVIWHVLSSCKDPSPPLSPLPLPR